MTRYERTLQLEKRKNIAMGVTTVAIVGAMLGGCFYVSAKADKEIDLSVNENEIVDVVATVPEVEEYELACVEVDLVEAPFELEEDEEDFSDQEGVEEVEEVEEIEETQINTTEKHTIEYFNGMSAVCEDCAYAWFEEYKKEHGRELKW